MKTAHALLLGLFIAFIPQRMHSMDNFCKKFDSSNSNLIIYAGTGLAGIGLCTLFYKLLTREESTASLFAKGRFCFDELHQKYARMRLHKLKNLNGFMSEQELEVLSDWSEISVLPELYSDKHRLQDIERRMHARVVRDAGKQLPEIGYMRKLLHQYKELHAAMHELEKFWNRHGNYFVIHTTVERLGEKYRQVGVNSEDLAVVKQAVMASFVGQSDYPFIDYARSLKGDIKQLRYENAKVKKYPVMHGLAETMLAELSKLLTTVVSAKEYHKELKLKKEHELEQQRIAAEQAKADAMQKQVAIERQKVYAMQEKVMAEQRKARALEEQNKIKKDEIRQQKEKELKKKQKQKISLKPPAQAGAHTQNNAKASFDPFDTTKSQSAQVKLN